jgi:heme exporter protein CcmD
MTFLMNLGPHGSFILASWAFGMGMMAFLILRAWLAERATRSRLKAVEARQSK